jgi:prepilin-type N-terminal cleavage/methylation domain-containing protein
MQNIKKNSGFTLIELMVVIVVIGICVAIGVPNFVGWLPKYRLKSAARDLYSNLQLAKLSAIKNNADWAIVFNKAPDQYQVCSGQGPDNSWGGGDNTVIKTVILNNYGSGVSYGHGNAGSAIGSTFGDEITFTNNVAVMNSRGTGNAGYVYLENSSAATSYGVGKRTNGLIILRRWNGANWEY